MAAGRRSIGAQRNPESEKAILTAARELLAEEGLAGFSIEAVARRAHAGKPTIYRWWPDRTRLLLAVYSEFKEGMRSFDTGTLEGDVRAFLTNLFEFWRESPAGPVFKSILAESQTDPEASAAFAEYHDGRAARTAAAFAQHGITDEDAKVLTELAVNYAWGQLLANRLDPGDAEIARVAGMLVRGVGK
jgi:AcrR family transcriptional regulator